MRYQYAQAMMAQELIAWRERLGLATQKEAAALLGISKFTMCRMEKGTQRIPAGVAILCYLMEDPEIRRLSEQYHRDNPVITK